MIFLPRKLNFKRHSTIKFFFQRCFPVASFCLPVLLFILFKETLFFFPVVLMLNISNVIKSVCFICPSTAWKSIMSLFFVFYSEHCAISQCLSFFNLISFTWPVLFYSVSYFVIRSVFLLHITDTSPLLCFSLSLPLHILVIRKANFLFLYTGTPLK